MSRLKYDYSTAARIVEALGGLDALEAVKEQVAPLDLPPCPFCGGEAVVALGNAYGRPTATVECSHCHSRTLFMTPGYDHLTGAHTKMRDAINDAALRWSMRRATA